ncbi:flagellar hook-length control protein FliK [Ruminococcaceae bacterium OttesenSCG-928-I18]|nr:flagellar hook-length control protein FliK [Ruminococcaceae bacterium OttesenSCG-928-I18]
MDTAIQSATAAVQTAQGLQGSAQESSSGISFAEILYNLNGMNPSANGQSGESGMGWREMQAYTQGYQNLGVLTQSDPTFFSLDDLVSKIMKMMMDEATSGVSDEEGGETAEEMLLLIEQLQKQLQQMQTEDGQTAMGQQLLVLMAQISGQQLTPTQNADGTLSLTLPQSQNILQMLMTAQPEDILQMLKGTPEGQAKLEAFTQHLQTMQAMAGKTQGNTTPQAAAGQTMQAELPVVEVQSQPVLKAQDPQTLFQNAVQTAKQQLESGEKPAGEQKPLTDIESLQQQANNNTAVRGTVITTGTAGPSGTTQVQVPFVTQMQQGIQTGLQSGQQEFSIKLMPEGLGEVTVRLTPSDEGMIMTLVTHRADTQKMLAAEIDQLRDSLRPMKIEVQEIMTSRQEALLNGQQNFFFGQNRQNWQEMHGAAYYGDEPLGEEAEEEPQPEPVLTANALDTYI